MKIGCLATSSIMFFAESSGKKGTSIILIWLFFNAYNKDALYRHSTLTFFFPVKISLKNCILHSLNGGK